MRFVLRTKEEISKDIQPQCEYYIVDTVKAYVYKAGDDKHIAEVTAYALNACGGQPILKQETDGLYICYHPETLPPYRRDWKRILEYTANKEACQGKVNSLLKDEVGQSEQVVFDKKESDLKKISDFKKDTLDTFAPMMKQRTYLPPSEANWMISLPTQIVTLPNQELRQTVWARAFVAALDDDNRISHAMKTADNILGHFDQLFTKNQPI